MTQLQRTIKEIALSIAPHYCYGTPRYLNARTDKMRGKGEMPACLHIQTADGSVNLSASAYYDGRIDTQRVQLGFADAVKFDQDPETTVAVVDELLDKGVTLIQKLRDTGRYSVNEAITYEVLYDTQDANLVWVLLTFNVTGDVAACIEP